LPCLQQARACRIPAAGLPVASITISIASDAIAADASSVTQVVPFLRASSNVR